MKQYILNVLAAISQIVNALLGGHPNMTLSARCYRERDRLVWGALRLIINAVFWFDEDHCYSSWVKDTEFCNGIKTL